MRTQPHFLTPLLAAFVSLFFSFSIHAVTNSWAYYDSPGHLAYQIWTNGNHIMDFSSAGYQGGGVAIPTNVATVVTVNPSGGDDTAAIQSAINTVAGHSLVNGFRGAVQLGAGTFKVSGQLNINSSGVVVRGTGSTNGTTIVMTNASSFLCFSLAGSGSASKSGTVSITDGYVSSGTNGINVSSASGFNVGDTIMLNRVVTTNWIHFMGMDTLVRSGVTQTWISAGSTITTDRKISGISGNHITLDAPITDSFDTNYLGIPAGTMSHYSWSGRISNVGLEHLRIVAPPNTNGYGAINISSIIDSWVRDIAIQDGINSVVVSQSAKRCTMSDINIIRTLNITGDPPADYTVTGTQILMNKCSSNGNDVWPFVTQNEGTGPIVALNFFTAETRGMEPHQRWSVGLLADNCSAPNAPSGEQGIAFFNRATDGSGHGWTMGWAVAWNDVTPYFLVTAAPGTEDWVIGGIGTQTSKSGQNNGIYDHFGSIVTPHSLYLEQLRERLGGAAVENIGYTLFTISNSPTVRTIAAGTNTTFSVNVGDPTLMSNAVTLAVDTLPANMGASFSTNLINGKGSATLTLTASNGIAPATYTLNIIGANAGLTHTSQVSVIVGTFSLGVNPTSQLVFPGNSTNFTVTLTTNGGFSGNVNFGIDGLPSGANANFSPTSLSGNGTSTLTVTTTGATLPGNYPLNIYGTNGAIVAITTANLIVTGSGTSPLWNGGSATGNYWNDFLNWSGVPLASGSALIFDGNARLNNTNNTTAGTIYSNIIFNSGASAFTLNGNSITLNGNVTNNSANPQTINFGINFGSSITFNGGSAGLNVAGPLTNTFGAPGATYLMLAGNGTLANSFKSVNSPGGTNLIAMNNASANWTLVDNSSSAAVTVPWIFAITNGTFNFGDADDAPTLTTTSARGASLDNQLGMASGGTATFNMVNGTLTTTARFNTATMLNSTGIVNQVGGTWNLGDQFQGANGGNAGEQSIINVSGGTMNIGGGGSTLFVASRGGGQLNLSGDGVVNCNILDVCRNASATVVCAGVVNLNGGILMVNRVGTASANAGTTFVSGTSATLNFNGGTLVAKTSATNFILGNLSAPTIPIATFVNLGANIDDGGNAITVCEPLQHDSSLGNNLDGGLTKIGSGTLTLIGSSTYTGDTTISNGTLALSGNGSISNSDNIFVNAGAILDVSARNNSTLTVATNQMLSGDGAVKGNVIVANGATLSPGTSLGILSFSNNLTLNGGSTTVIEMDASATTNDVAQVAGTLTCGGTLVLTNLNGNFSAGQSFKLFSAGTITGAFTNISPAIPDVNLAWNTNQLSSGIISIITQPTPLPHLSGTSAAGNNFIFNASGGIPNWAVTILASANVAAPLNQWQPIATNNFDGNGNFIFTNSLDPNSPQLFYLLQMQ